MSPAAKDWLCVLAFGAFVAWTFPGMILDAAEYELERTAPSAVCDTDTDCLAHCPPPMDDPECDGGPDGEQFEVKPN